MYDCDPKEQRSLTGHLNAQHYMCDHLNGIVILRNLSVCDMFYERQYSSDFPELKKN